MKKIILLLMAVSVVFLAASAGFAARKLPYKVVVVAKVDGIAWFDRERIGINEFAEEVDMDFWMVGPAKADAAEQVQVIENVIAQGVDCIAVVPFSVEAIEPVLKKAREQGIKVISSEATNQINADVIIEPFDSKAYGAEMMKDLATHMGGKGGYITTVGSLTSTSHMEWIDAAIAHQEANYPDMYQVAPRLETYDDATIDYQKIKEALVAHSDLKGVCGGPMPTSAGAGLAIEERGLQGKVFFSGTGLPSIARQYLKNDSIQSIYFWDPAVIGKVFGKIAIELLEGREIKEGTNLGLPGFENLKQDPVKKNLFYGNGWIHVTKENVDEYDF